MTKKRKTRKTKIIKKHTQRSIVITFFLINGRLLFWIAKQIYFHTRKNTLLAIGFFLFSISFGFVSFNALFSQVAMHQDVSTQMEFISISGIGKSSNLPKKEAKFQTDTHIIPVPIPNNLRKNPPSHSFSESTLKIQKKLAQLGFYDGSLDGVEGPKTRRAIVLWKQQNADRVQNSALPKSTIDEIAILIQHSEMEMANDTTKTSNLPSSKETILESPMTDIVQVQKALRIFGHQEVIVTGVEDQNTIDALKQFQKIFNLPITGKVNHTVLMKMREIGLLN
ncbi:peptidoglycan-binding domain-containing protein [Bartonella sp. B35(2025)]